MQGGRAEETLRVATYAVLAAVGVLAGVVGCFLVPEQVGGFGYLAAVIAAAGNLTVGLIGGLGTQRVGGAIAPFVGWLLSVGLLVTEPFVSRGGDVVIPGSLGNAHDVVYAGFAFMSAGVVAAVAPILLTSRYTERVNAPKSIS